MSLDSQANTQLAIVELDTTSNKRPIKIDDLRARKTDELIIAMVGPIGSGCSKSADKIISLLKDDYGYSQVVYHKVSDVITKNAALVGIDIPGSLDADERVSRLQDAGNKLRDKFLDDYLSAKIIENIATHRLEHDGFKKAEGGNLVPEPLRHAHVIDSLKNPAELSLLREVYGDMLWVIGVFAPEGIRKNRLKNLEGWAESKISALFDRDNKQEWHYGQGVRDTFFQADFFIRNDGENDTKLEQTLERSLEIIFGFPVHTPKPDESAMYSAYSAAAQSACLSRQVGASIVSANGELIGVGWNDVPAFEGGLYSPAHGNNDHRCYMWSQHVCHNDKKKQALYKEIFDALQGSQLLKDAATKEQTTEALKDTDIRQLIEYSRAVHAEMEAIISVARGNKAGLTGSTLYCTTFPCHSCARHILASGITKVVYIEPYPKSLAIELHYDAISVDEKDLGKKLVFLQFEGVSPRNMLRLFKPHEVKRKNKDTGKLVDFDKKKAHPLGSVSVDDFSTHEKRVLTRLKDLESEPA